MCAHHTHLPLYGGGAGDVLACSTALAGATLSGMSRIVADRHYASDVLAAATVGILSGYLLPELLHYHFTLPSFQLGAGDTRAILLPAASSDTLGLQLWGAL
jgi:membrane-associated phospholipid phosphatase